MRGWWNEYSLIVVSVGLVSVAIGILIGVANGGL